MSNNVLTNVGLIYYVCEKSPKNTKVTRTKAGAVPWQITSVFPELKKTQIRLLDHSSRPLSLICSSYCRRSFLPPLTTVIVIPLPPSLI